MTKTREERLMYGSMFSPPALNATHVGILHPYQFCVFEKEMQEIMKTYTYAYSGEEI